MVKAVEDQIKEKREMPIIPPGSGRELKISIIPNYLTKSV